MSRSLSPSVDGDYHDDEPTSKSAGKPGRKKGPSNQAARRDQNRIAQREFRLRKQQRIRDLEARVEILSGTKEETYSHTRVIIQGLMEENARLRALVRDLGGFMADGLGGPLLDKTGWSMAQFKDFINRADSDTAYEAFVKAKSGAVSVPPPPPPPSSGLGMGTMGPSPSEAEGSGRNKRKRGDSATPATPDYADASGPPSSMRRTSYSNSTARGNGNGIIDNGNNNNRAQSPSELNALLPMHNDFHDPREGPSSFEAFCDTLNSSAAAPFLPLSTPGVPSSNGSTPVALPGYSPDMTGFINNNYVPNSTDSPGDSSGAGLSAADRENRSELSAADDAKMKEAGKLIRYHLQNYRRNENYFLPASLRPTLVQRTVSHHPLIDGVVIPEVRDRMILLKDQYDLAKCLTMFLWTTRIHGDDVLAHANIEIGETWLRTYGFLVDESALAITNKWRRTRGDRELTMQEITGNPDGTAAPLVLPSGQ